jgi:hypothetical protein
VHVARADSRHGSTPNQTLVTNGASSVGELKVRMLCPAGTTQGSWMKVGYDLVDDLLYDPQGVLREVAGAGPREALQRGRGLVAQEVQRARSWLEHMLSDLDLERASDPPEPEDAEADADVGVVLPPSPRGPLPPVRTGAPCPRRLEPELTARDGHFPSARVGWIRSSRVPERFADSPPRSS